MTGREKCPLKCSVFKGRSDCSRKFPGFEFGEEMVVVGELAGGAVLGTALSLLRAAFIDVIKKICVHPTHLKRFCAKPDEQSLATSCLISFGPQANTPISDPLVSDRSSAK
ncbi:hypothetical protein ACLB2K_070425 [Fragaria x ananassa]